MAIDFQTGNLQFKIDSHLLTLGKLKLIQTLGRSQLFY